MPDPGDAPETLPGADEGAVATLTDAGIDPADVRERAVSYRDLLAAGLDRTTATRLRREFSLPYSTRFGEGIEDRSEEVTGLQSGEREWVAASASDWEALGVPEYDPVEREPEDVWADRDRPVPVERVSGVGPDDRAALATVGITSARQLGIASAATVARLLDLDVRQVRLWRHAARDLTDRL